MLIINADDWGRSVQDTNAAAVLVRGGQVTSISAMVFMEDSERAADLARTMDVDVGLHLNLCEPLNAPGVAASIVERHEAIARFLNKHHYAQVMFQPFLRSTFRAAYATQVAEFQRLYRCEPSHVDGHRHLHLCLNMLVDLIIPRGSRVRRSFSFSSNERGPLNRTFRRLVDARLRSRYILTDHFFSLGACLGGTGRPVSDVFALALASDVELMTHPRDPDEFAYLQSEECAERLKSVSTGARSIGQGRRVERSEAAGVAYVGPER